MEVVPAQAAAMSLYQEQTYYFCARTCKAQFAQDPNHFLHPAQQLSEYARTLYEALGAMSKVFYGSTMRLRWPRPILVSRSVRAPTWRWMRRMSP
jgi:YHS domain-containing protein